MILVRDARPEDASDVVRVQDAAFVALRRIYRPSDQAIAHAKTLPLARIVAIDDERLVGTVQHRIDGDRLRVVALAVAPDAQRHGIARALVEQLVETARRRECSALALFTIEQTGNVAVFERLGFAVVSRRPETWSISVRGDALVEVYMERAI